MKNQFAPIQEHSSQTVSLTLPYLTKHRSDMAAGEPFGFPFPVLYFWRYMKSFNRRCPGIHFANSNLLIASAHILTLFEIEEARNRDGSIDTPVPLVEKRSKQVCYIVDLLSSSVADRIMLECSRPERLRCLLKPWDPALCNELKQEHTR